jgi:hypothetical protein
VKRSRIKWLILLATSAFGYYMVHKPAQAPMRIVVEGDVSDSTAIDPARVTVGYDPYLVRENYFSKIILADSKSAAQSK